MQCPVETLISDDVIGGFTLTRRGDHSRYRRGPLAETGPVGGPPGCLPRVTEVASKPHGCHLKAGDPSQVRSKVVLPRNGAPARYGGEEGKGA